MIRNNGIEYKKTGERSRGVVNRYHGKPAPRKMHKTPFHVDIAGLKPIQRQQVIQFDGREYGGRFTIGFEVEKTQFHRDAVKEYEIFCGFETDISCGYEAVTNILPLLPAGSWRNKVFDMMYKAEQIIDDRFSPSDTSCGGHITCTVQGMDRWTFLDLIRPHMGIIMSLYRGRLTNRYCSANLTMLGRNHSAMSEWFNYDNEHYTFAHPKTFEDGTSGIEFRAPSRFQSVRQMMRRYELFYELINFAVNNPTGTHEQLMRLLGPVMLALYGGNTAKAAETIRLAKFFRKFILTGKVNTEVQPFVDPSGKYKDTRWERSAIIAYNHGRVAAATSGDD